MSPASLSASLTFMAWKKLASSSKLAGSSSSASCATSWGLLGLFSRSHRPRNSKASARSAEGFSLQSVTRPFCSVSPRQALIYLRVSAPVGSGVCCNLGK